MKDATLATICVALERLRADLKAGKVTRAAVLVAIGDAPARIYFSVKAEDEDDAKAYIGNVVLEAVERGGLITKEEIDAL